MPESETTAVKLGLASGLAVNEPEPDWSAVDVLLALPEAADVSVTKGEPLAEADLVGVPLWAGDAELLGVAADDSEATAECDSGDVALAKAVGERVGVAVSEPRDELLGDGAADEDADAEVPVEAEGEAVDDPLAERGDDADAEADSAGLAVADAESVGAAAADADALGEPEGDAKGVGEAEAEALPLAVMLSEAAGVPEPLSLVDALEDRVA